MTAVKHREAQSLDSAGHKFYKRYYAIYMETYEILTLLLEELYKTLRHGENYAKEKV